MTIYYFPCPSMFLFIIIYSFYLNPTSENYFYNSYLLFKRFLPTLRRSRYPTPFHTSRSRYTTTPDSNWHLTRWKWNDDAPLDDVRRRAGARTTRRYSKYDRIRLVEFSYQLDRWWMKQIPRSDSVRAVLGLGGLDRS